MISLLFLISLLSYDLNQGLSQQGNGDYILNYSIEQVAAKMGTNASTLRYYDKKGLLPFVDRDAAGRRQFKDNDFNFLEVIDCLKKSGVPVKDIGKFISLCLQGDGTLHQRYDYLDHEEGVLEQRCKK